MNNLVIIPLFLFLTFDIYCQDNQAIQSIDYNTLFSKIEELDDIGVLMTEDSFFINNETRRLLSDSVYRRVIYPDMYSWNGVQELITKQELKKAFWYFINLYSVNEENRNFVLKSILTYDSIFDMKTVMVNVFYSYCFMDPEIGMIKNGIPEMTSPDIFEKKLGIVKEIVMYIDKYRDVNSGSGN